MLGPNQQKWVDALRSGEYEQGKEYLEDDNKYCCLGIACSIAEENGIAVNKNIDGSLSGFTLRFQTQAQEWLGIIDDIGRYQCTSLARLNDDGSSFLEIADVIEKHAEELFSEPR